MVNFLQAPGFLSDRSNLGSDISLLFALLFSSMYVISGFQAVKKRGLTHHRMILVSTVTMCAYFVFYYNVRQFGVASFTDRINFAGSGQLYAGLFKPVLYLHFTIVCLSVFLAIYTILSGFKSSVRSGETLILNSQQVGISKRMWFISFIWLAFLTWWLVSMHAFGWGYKILFLFLAYFLPAMVAIFINKVLPLSDDRHRILGRLCMVSFAGLFLTSMITYSLLYII